MRKPEFGLIALAADLKDDFSACPLVLVFHRVQLAVRDTPNNLLTRHQFGDLLGAAVNVFVMELKRSTELVGATLDFL